MHHSIILYDGHCMLCSSFVQRVLQSDDLDLFRFCPIQSKKANELLGKAGYTEQVDLSTILLITKDGVYDEARAALMILTKLKGFYPLLGLGWILPSFLRNMVYRWVAKNRIKWFGGREECFIPDSTWRYKLMTDE